MPLLRLSRLYAELRAAPSAADGEEAIVRLFAERANEGNAIEVGLHGAQRFVELGEREADVVRFAPGIYTSIPTTEARVQLLSSAQRVARRSVVVHVAVIDEATHLGRAAIDTPRRILRRAGLPVAEPGDRFGPERYAHCFFDEEALRDEVRSAGLDVAERRGFTFVLAPISADVSERADSFRREIARVVTLVRTVDDQRRKSTPQQAVATMRSVGRDAMRRGPIGRARLRRAIGWVDALLPGGASCYRRVLLETALDAGAAGETLVFGLDVGRTGHVAFENREERAFDVSFAIPADP